MIERKKYLERLIARKENGLVKVITGIRRCGKSYLLFNIYKSYLKSIGVEDDQIICLALDVTKTSSTAIRWSWANTFAA